MRRRNAMFVVVAGLLALAVVRHPHADIQILTHDVGDVAPGRVMAAVDVGIGAVSLLVTWSRT